MPYKVLNDFIENEHKGLKYQKGELYPKTGFEADPERVAFLQEDHEKYKKRFLGLVIETEESEIEQEPEKLANDDEVDSKQEAAAAEEETKPKSKTKTKPKATE